MKVEYFKKKIYVENLLNSWQSAIESSLLNDSVIIIANNPNTGNPSFIKKTNSITAANGDNNISAEGGANSISSGTGADTISVTGASNSVTTGSGNDKVTATGASNTISTEAGDDTISVTAASNKISSGETSLALKKN